MIIRFLKYLHFAVFLANYFLMSMFMKRLFAMSALALSLALVGCKGDNTAKPATTTITEQSTDSQKVGYAIGYDMGRNLKEVADDLDLSAFNQGFKEAFEGKDSVITEDKMRTLVQDYMVKKQEEMMKKLEEKAKQNKADGEKFLAENAKKEGVKTTESGLQYKVIREGAGESPKATDTVVVNYEGKLIDGKVFDSSYERGEPISFPLNQVIPGWTEGLQLMKPGAEYELYIPSDLAYGEAGNPEIEPNSVLIFKVELLDEKAAKEAMEKAAAAQEAQMKEMMAAMQEQVATPSEAPAEDKKEEKKEEKK